MMNTIVPPNKLIESALSSVPLEFERRAPAAWDVSLADGLTMPAVLDENLFRLTFALPVPGPEEAPLNRDDVASQLLAWNSQLPGGARFQLGKSYALGLGQYLPESGRDGKHLATGLKAIEEGWRLLRHWLESGEILPVTCPDNATVDPAPDLAAIAADAGWPYRESTNGTILFELEGEMPFRQARLSVQMPGRIRLSLELNPDGELSVVSHRAVAWLLLRLNNEIPVARAVAETVAGQTQYLMEVTWGRAPLSEELFFGLEELNVAGRQFGHEIQALFSPDVAESALEVGLGSPQSVTETTKQQKDNE